MSNASWEEYLDQFEQSSAACFPKANLLRRLQDRSRKVFSQTDAICVRVSDFRSTGEYFLSGLRSFKEVTSLRRRDTSQLQHIRYRGKLFTRLGANKYRQLAVPNHVSDLHSAYFAAASSVCLYDLVDLALSTRIIPSVRCW